MSAYLDKMEAQTYFSQRLRTSAWDSASNSDRDKALAEATRLIDRLNFAGDKANEDQDNQFPRGEDTEVPSAIKNACCEIAIRLLEAVDPEKEIESQFIDTSNFSSLSKKRKQHPQVWTLTGIPGKLAWDYLLPFLRDIESIEFERVS